MLTSEEAEW